MPGKIDYFKGSIQVVNPPVAKIFLTGPGQPVRKGFRAGPFDDAIIHFGSFAGIHLSGFGLHPLHVNKTRHLKP
jgi:hypothetical protein